MPGACGGGTSLPPYQLPQTDRSGRNMLGLGVGEEQSARSGSLVEIVEVALEKSVLLAGIAWA